MNPDKNPRPASPDKDSATDANPAAARTPSTDMQPEDAGTPESGNADSGSAAESAMKQTSKTPAERGDR